MLTRLVTLIFLISLSVQVQALTLSPAWKTKPILKNPESVIYHPTSNSLYISNVNGSPTSQDGNGFISQYSDDGELKKLHWLDGLNAPKGLAIQNNTLYVADINQLVVIDIMQHKITHRYQAKNAKFLNDVAIDNPGRVYVSDTLTNTIYRLDNGKFSAWLTSPKLLSPNGLLVQNNNLIVASWGHVIDDNLTTDKVGYINKVNIKTKQITPLGNASAIGNLDGIEADNLGGYIVSDWMAGKIYQVDPSGKSHALLTLKQGSADISIMPEKNLLIVPMMMDNTLEAFHITK